jgi:acyl-CoA thioesterase
MGPSPGLRIASAGRKLLGYPTVLDFDHQPDGRYGFDLTPELARFDGRLFGGAGLAASVGVLEAATQRHALWTTVQFIGSAEIGERIDCRAEVLAAGYNTTQAQVTATTDGRTVFIALGSTAREREDGFTADIGAMPTVPGPDECPTWLPKFPFPVDRVTARGPFATAEFRLAHRGDGSMVLWTRMKEMHQSRLTVAYLADFVPSAVLRAAGRDGGGTSLDNSIRFGKAPATGLDWILIDTEPYLADGGYLHGGARIWSPDGTLLAVASQTAVARLFG